MRAIQNLFCGQIPGANNKKVRRELGRFAGTLGKCRDLDVLCTSLLDETPGETWRKLRTRRKQAHRQLRNKLVILEAGTFAQEIERLAQSLEVTEALQRPVQPDLVKELLMPGLRTSTRQAYRQYIARFHDGSTPIDRQPTAPIESIPAVAAASIA